jgi:hypothetical protein
MPTLELNWPELAAVRKVLGRSAYNTDASISSALAKLDTLAASKVLAASGRTVYYKAARTDLLGPHYSAGIGRYLPGGIYTPDWLDPDDRVSCTHGLYYTSHIRVAARWGPVILRVRVLGEKVKVQRPVKPTQGIPDKSGRYYKYRTDRMLVEDIVALSVHTSANGDGAQAYRAGLLLGHLNGGLEGTGNHYRLTGKVLEHLRTQPGDSEQHRVWELERDAAW